MKTLIAVLALLMLASATAQAQPRRPEQQAAEQGWADAAAHNAGEPRQPPDYYIDCINCTSTQYSYWNTYWPAVTHDIKRFTGR
jgi:hypothetical protein